jgi:hypothetical protein
MDADELAIQTWDNEGGAFELIQEPSVDSDTAQSPDERKAQVSARPLAI